MTRRLRLNQIVRIVTKEHKVSVQRLSELFKISAITLRRDLAHLESYGLVQRYHGGVLSLQSAKEKEVTFAWRQNKNPKIKQNIITKALDFIQEDQSIFLDDSTTVLYLIPYLLKFKSLTVVTNSLFVVKELEFVQSIKLICIGGEYNKQSFFFDSPLFYEQLKAYPIDIALLGVYGFTAKSSLENSASTALFKSNVSKWAAKTIIFTDNSKFYNHEGIPSISIDNISQIYTNFFTEDMPHDTVAPYADIITYVT